MKQTRAFRCQPESVAAARQFVLEALAGRSPELADAAELMVSELATNSVRHAQTDFEITIDLQDVIRIEVRDTGDGRPTVLSPSAQEPSGRGLLIVEAMASTWGIDPSATGKTVWFTLAQRASRGEEPARVSAEQAAQPDESQRSPRGPSSPCDGGPSGRQAREPRGELRHESVCSGLRHHAPQPGAQAWTATVGRPARPRTRI